MGLSFVKIKTENGSFLALPVGAAVAAWTNILEFIQMLQNMWNGSAKFSRGRSRRLPDHI